MTTRKFVLGHKFISHHYNKSDVETHTEGYYGRGYPAVNVKVYHFPRAFKAIEHFHCTEEQAEKALEYAWNMAQTDFWEDAPNIAIDIFGKGIKVYSAGRSGGWLIVQGLDDIEYWDAVALAKWHKFEKAIKEAVKWYTSEEKVYEDIDANRWAEEGAEQYNYVEFKDGHSECVVDLKIKDKQSD